MIKETKILTEIRDYGDKKTIVVYTNNNEICHKLRDSKKCFNIITYEQEQNGKNVLVGVDLYFSRKDLGWLKQLLDHPEKGNF